MLLVNPFCSVTVHVFKTHGRVTLYVALRLLPALRNHHNDILPYFILSYVDCHNLWSKTPFIQPTHVLSPHETTPSSWHVDLTFPHDHKVNITLQAEQRL